jgi:hypothetical protein
VINESSLSIGFIFFGYRLRVLQLSVKGLLLFVTSTNPSMDPDYKNGQSFLEDIFNPPGADKIKWEND